MASALLRKLFGLVLARLFLIKSLWFTKTESWIRLVDLWRTLDSQGINSLDQATLQPTETRLTLLSAEIKGVAPLHPALF